MKIIGLCGKARSGKTTIATVMCAAGYYPISLAEPIKTMLLALGINEPEHKEKPFKLFPETEDSPYVTYRQLTQTLGTEWGRYCIDEDMWLKHLQSRITTLERGGIVRKIVITDVRFENEAQWVRKMGHLWHISRSNRGPTHHHISEAGIKPIGHEIEIVNDGTIDELRAMIMELIK